jgi:hypothetical protein
MESHDPWQTNGDTREFTSSLDDVREVPASLFFLPHREIEMMPGSLECILSLHF